MGQRSGEPDASADPITGDWAATRNDESVKHEGTGCKSFIGSLLSYQPRLIRGRGYSH